MAPGDQNDFSQDRIDVSLDLVGEGSLRAMEQLTAQLSNVSAYFNAISMVPEVAAQGQRAAAGSRQAGVMHGVHPYQSRPGQTPPVVDGAGQAASVPPNAEQVAEQRLADLGNQSMYRRLRSAMQGGGVTELVESYGARERSQVRERSRMGLPNYTSSNDMITSTVGGYRDTDMGTGGLSNYASTPPNAAADTLTPSWMRALRSNPQEWTRAEEGFQLPAEGLGVNMQQKLQIASDFLQRSATRRYQGRVSQAATQAHTDAMGQVVSEGASMGISEDAVNRAVADDPTYFNQLVQERQASLAGSSGRAQGTASALLRMGSDQYGAFAVARQELRRATQWGSGMQQQGVQAGFERGQTATIPGTDIGFQLPDFSSDGAFREAARQRLSTERLRMKGGISQQQAGEIVGNLASYGWTGREGQNMAFDTISPLVQQGQNPNVVTSLFDQAIRNGNTSLQAFRDTMNDLGPSARAARMTLDEYQQALGDFANQAQEHGALFGQGLSLGRNLSTGFGMTPQQSGSLLQSPLTQSMAMFNYGALPNEIGALPEGAVAGSTLRSVDLAMRAAAPFGAQPLTDRRTGNVIMSGSERQKIQAAQFMGVSRETFEHLLNGRKVAPHIFQAQSQLRQYQGNTRALGDHAASGARVVQGDVHPGDIVATNRNTPGAKQYGDNLWGIRATVEGHGDHIVLPTGAGAAGRQTNQLWNSIDKQLRAVAPQGGPDRTNYLKSVDALRREAPDQRIKNARRLLDERAKTSIPGTDSGNDVNVHFTGAAAKWFEQEQRNGRVPQALQDANRGGTPINRYATSGATQSDFAALFAATPGSP